jgi:hypothetical protein
MSVGKAAQGQIKNANRLVCDRSGSQPERSQITSNLERREDAKATSGNRLNCPGA